MRSRDERFDDSAKYKQETDPLHDKSPAKKVSSLYGPQDFTFDRDAHSCVCPAGHELYGNGRECKINGHVAIRFRGSEAACGPCRVQNRAFAVAQRFYLQLQRLT